MPRKKKSEITPEVKESKPAERKEKPEAVYIYHEGDDITKISKLLTGKEYLTYKLLEFNNLDINNLKDGTVLTWEI